MGIFGVVLFDDCYYDSGNSSVGCLTSMSLAGSKRGDACAMLQSSLGQYQNSDADVATSYLNPGSIYQTCNRVIDGLTTQQQCDEVRSVAYWKPSNMPTGTTPPGGFLVAWPWSESLSSYQWSYVTTSSQYYFFHASTMSTNPWGTTPAVFPGGTLAMTVNVAERTCGSSAAAVVWATAGPNPNPPGSCGIFNQARRRVDLHLGGPDPDLAIEPARNAGFPQSALRNSHHREWQGIRSHVRVVPQLP